MYEKIHKLIIKCTPIERKMINFLYTCSLKLHFNDVLTNQNLLACYILCLNKKLK